MPGLVIAISRDRGRRSLDEFGNTKVEDLDQTIGPQHHILRLDVAMNDSGFVGSLEGARNLDADIERHDDGDGRGHLLAKRLALDILGGYVVLAVGFAYIEDGDDVR